MTKTMLVDVARSGALVPSKVSVHGLFTAVQLFKLMYGSIVATFVS